MKRTNSHTGEDFVGCSSWPDCNYTRPMSDDEFYDEDEDYYPRWKRRYE